MSGCSEVMPNVWVCRGPRTEPHSTGIMRSASYCFVCRRRRVHELIAHHTVEPSYYGPHFTWSCPCGGSKPATKVQS